MKKIVIILLAMIFSLSVVGCGNNKNSIFLEIEDSIVGLNSSVRLNVNAEYEQEKIVWSSTDAEILKVENGVVTGLAEGKAKIQAVYNGQTQTQKIKVEKQDFQLEAKDSIALAIGQKYLLEASLGNTAPTDKEVIYSMSVSDDLIATVDGMEITALASGSTTIDVKAEVDGEIVAEKTIEINIYDNVGIFSERKEYNLYLTEELRGVSFEKSIELLGEIYCDGKIYQEGQLSWSVSDESIAKIEDSNKIVAVSTGETTVVASCEINGNTYSSILIPVNVAPSIVDLNDDVIIDISKSEQIFNSASLFGAGQAVGYIENCASGKGIAITDNKVKTSTFTSGEYEYIIYNKDKTMATHATIHCANFVVYDLEDLIEIRKIEHVNDYIVLANDVEVNASFGDRLNNVFEGTFNGLGHKIIGMKLSKRDSGGLFYAVRGATVKNVAFIDTVISTWNSGVIAYWNPYEMSVIDNVYVEVRYEGDDVFFSGGIIGFGHVGEIQVKNSIVLVDGLNREPIKEGNGLIIGRLYVARTIIQDVYVIGEGNVCGSRANAYNTAYETLNNNMSYVYANEELFTNERAKDGSRIKFEGFNHYWDLGDDNEVPCFN